MFRTVFLEIKRNIPLNTHQSLVSLQELHGVPMGFHHYHRKSATEMMNSMSNYMHKQLVDYMFYSNLPFSIIIDGSTDKSNNHYLIIYFQLLENDVPILCFYKLVETSSTVTAKGYFESIQKAMYTEDVDFYGYFKKHLVGYVSDGEKVMSGKEGGLISYIRKIAHHPVYAVHCMAHRMHLAVEKAYAQISYFGEFDKLINKLFQFYNWNSSKKKKHLKETAEKHELPFYQLNYIYRTRWISSELQSISSLKKSWLLITKDLHIISNNVDNFRPDTRNRAQVLLEEIKDRKFVAILHFVSDVLQHLSFWSKKMQERTALLADFVEFSDKITSTFTGLKTQNGKDLNLMLENSVCDGEPCESIEHFYDAEEVKYFDSPLIHSNSETDVPTPYIGEIREIFLEGIISAINSFFPSSDLNLFKIFLPSKIPTDIAGSLSYGVREISKLCNIFKLMDCDELQNDWEALLESIIESESFCVMRTGKTETFAFWTHFLNRVGIKWTDLTKMLVRIVLVMPIGSAEAERGFSIMNDIKTKRNSNLCPNNLESIMRIRINTNDNLEKFAASKYALQWTKENHFRTDDPKQQRRDKKNKNLIDDEEENLKYLPKLSFL